MANQIMIANTLFGVCESFVYATAAGVNHDQIINLLKKGAAGSAQLEKLGPRMLRRDFEPGFYMEHFFKDLTIALEECDRMGIELPSLKHVYGFYKIYMDQGGAKEGTQGFLQVLERLNKKETKKYDI